MVGDQEVACGLCTLMQVELCACFAALPAASLAKGTCTHLLPPNALMMTVTMVVNDDVPCH